MKRKAVSIRLTFLSAVIIVICCNACAKKENVNTCRTCTARYNGETIATIEACNAESEENFKSSHYYATVSCQ